MSRRARIYLGLDASTQSLTALVIRIAGAERRALFERSLDYDAELPGYGTRRGVLPSDAPGLAVSSPLMWAEALDRVMGVVSRECGAELPRLRAVSGSAQQHGTVYLTGAATSTLTRLDPAHPLIEQLDGMLARATAPIWMDASTAEQCAAITRAVGGPDSLARLTGSRAFERFAGPQIRKFAETDPEAYERTDRIHLVSSYHASLLAGAHAPIEPGDGAGMNLMDIARRRWAPAALAATAEGLERRLPAIEPSWTALGPLARYWRERYGLPPARVIAWSGDNPCSLIGVGIVREGRVAVSLGTSDTLFGVMDEPRVDPTGAAHVFGAPTGAWMSLVCCTNGSLAREQIAREHALDWEGFSRALRERPPGNRGAVMLPWFVPESTPTVHQPGVRRYGLDPADAPANVRAVVEAQMLALALHSEWMGVRVNAIHATGGAAANDEILQILADVFDADVYRPALGNAAALGAALRAYHADQAAEGRHITWDEVITGFAEPAPAGRIRPVAAHVAAYRDLRAAYAACEAHALGNGGDPTPLLETFRSRWSG